MASEKINQSSEEKSYESIGEPEPESIQGTPDVTPQNNIEMYNQYLE